MTHFFGCRPGSVEPIVIPGAYRALHRCFTARINKESERDPNQPPIRPSGPACPHPHPLLTGDDPLHKRRELLAYFCQTFDLYDSLFDCLADERAWFNKAIPRHPLIFYYGHTAAFFVNKLLAARLIESRLDPRIEALVAIGVDEMSWDDLDETHYDWPTVAELRDYRGRVRALVCDSSSGCRSSCPSIGRARPGSS